MAKTQTKMRSQDHQANIFAISPISSTRSLYCVGEQLRYLPDCADAQTGLDLYCFHMFLIPFAQLLAPV